MYVVDFTTSADACFLLNKFFNYKRYRGEIGRLCLRFRCHSVTLGSNYLLSSGVER